MSRDRDNDKNIEKLIKDSYNDVDIDIPRGITPDNINVTGDRGAEYDDIDVPEYGIGKKQRSDKRKKAYRAIGGIVAAAAAVFCIMLSAGQLKNDAVPGISNRHEGRTSDKGDITQNEHGGSTEASESDDNTPALSSYKEIYELVSGAKKQEKLAYIARDGIEYIARDGIEEAAEDIVNESAVQSANAGKKQAFSDTNIQAEGVDEADIVKTDGEYIYILSRSIHYEDGYPIEDGDGYVVNIIHTDNGNMEKTACIKLADSNKKELKKSKCGNSTEGIYANEMYLYNDRLIVIVTEYNSSIDNEQSCVMIYDVSEPSNPKLVKNITMSGEYSDSRCSGGYLYMFSRYYAGDDIRAGDYQAYIPQVEDKLIECQDICVPENIETSSYMVMMTVDISNADKLSESNTTDKKAVLFGESELYVSTDSIYLLKREDDYNSSGYNTVTDILRYSYADGRIKYIAQTKLDGYVDSRFSADEYDGNLRLVTTVDRYNSKTGKEKHHNALYVLNGKLEVIGKINNIAKDERIYSARFYGEYGYFVTYREMDPLFTVDLSNPEKPEIISELELPGFSDYLQGFGEDRLFGIGYGVAKKAKDTYQRDALKISMFNISDKDNVKEEQTLVLDDYEDSEACRNHRSLLLDYSRNLIGFEARAYKDDGEIVKYLVYSYDDNRFKLQGTVDFAKEMNIKSSYLYGLRGIFIGEYLYIIESNSGILSCTINGLDKADTVKFFN